MAEYANKIIAKGTKTLRQLIISENATLDTVVNPHTGTLFFACGTKQGYISDKAQEMLQDMTLSEDAILDTIYYSECSKDGGANYVPTLHTRSTDNIKRSFGTNLLRK